MTAPDLPEDLGQWPEDPYELLGVQPGVAARDLRRAYTRRIRIYKPEQYPEHFRRIRAAYEAVLRHVEMFGLFHSINNEESAENGESEPTTNGEPPALSESEAVAEDASQTEPLPMPRSEEEDEEPEAEDNEEASSLRPPDLYRQLQDCWELACTGKEAEAYEQLRSLRDGYPDAEEIYVRLYWLLVVAPEVDPARVPADWLLAGLRDRGLAGPLRELLRREIEETPSLAFEAGCNQLLQGSTRPNLLTDFIDWRWRAAGQLERWDVISTDLEAVREPFLAEDEEAWARLLLLAMDHLAWARGEKERARFRHCLELLEKMVHLHSRLAGEMDRVDLLQILAGAWHHTHQRCAQSKAPLLRSVNLQLLQLIAVSWSRPYPEIQAVLEPFLGTIVGQPQVALTAFDSMKEYGSALLTQYHSTLLRYQYMRDKQAPADECSAAATEVAVEFMHGSEFTRYETLHARLLDFCLQESISPWAIAALIRERDEQGQSRPGPLGFHSNVADTIDNDWPLRCVFLSCWLYWA